MAYQSGCPWIKVQDFVESSLWVSFENSSTDTFLARDAGVELIELYDQGLMLNLPKKTCSRGHIVIVQLGKKTVRPFEPDPSPVFTEAFRATAKVVATDPIGPPKSGRMMFTLRFYQYQEGDWQKFLSSFSGRQAELNRLLRRMQD